MKSHSADSRMAFLLYRNLHGIKEESFTPGFYHGYGQFCFLHPWRGTKTNGYVWGDWVVLASMALGAIHWLWSMVDVLKGDRLDSHSKIFWLILVMLIPPWAE